MGRTRPLLQQIIMGVKINLAKWSDALLETSNCFSLILLPPPHSLRAANDAVVGADVSLGEEGARGLPPRGRSPSGANSPLAAVRSHGSHPSSRAPHPNRAPPPPCPLQHQARPVGNCWEGKDGDLFSLHPDPPELSAEHWGDPVP